MTIPTAPPPTDWYLAVENGEPTAAARSYWPASSKSEVYNPRKRAWVELSIAMDLLDSPMWQNVPEAEVTAWIEALPKALSQQPTEAAGFEPWEHLQGANGWWVEVGAQVSVKSDGTRRRGVVTALTAHGTQVTYKAGNVVEVIPCGETKSRITPVRKSITQLRKMVNQTAGTVLSKPRYGLGDVDLDREFVNWLLLEGEHGNTTARRWLRQASSGTWEWAPERRELHDRIVIGELARTRSTNGARRFNMLGGGPASGKSTLREVGLVHGVMSGSVVADSDDLKNQLPEYQMLVRSGDPAAAAIAHGESSYLATRVYQAALENRMSITTDSTGDGRVDQLIERIDTARAAEYEVHGYYTTVPVEVALIRNEKRRISTGRSVPSSVIKAAHTRVSIIFQQLYRQFDSVVLYDSSTPFEMVRVMEYNRTSGLRVHSRELWDQFVAKGR